MSNRVSWDLLCYINLVVVVVAAVAAAAAAAAAVAVVVVVTFYAPMIALGLFKIWFSSAHSTPRKSSKITIFITKGGIEILTSNTH